jgi:cobyrinic acid a,c-diamide synthase
MGFELFDPALCLGGVILNQVASDNHFKILQAAIRSACKTPVLGWLPRESAIAIPGRHLGLQTAEEFEDSAKTEQQINTLGALAEKHFDLDALLEFECGLDFESLPINYINKPASIRIGVARDRAFSFYYEDNLDLLREQGAEIVEFSPLVDATLPDNLDALYLGGGYPELHAEQLSSNRSMHSAIRKFANSERPIYAECGGMIYLSRQLTTIDGSVHAMAAALPFSVEMTSKLVQFGYVTIELTQDCLLGTAGTVLRGHSFHYSRIADKGAVSTSFRIRYSLSGKEEDEGYTFGNTLASYIHVHFRTFPPIANTFVELARSVRARELATT